MSTDQKSRFPSITKQCLCCGKDFKAYHSKIIRGRAKYCSKKCTDIYFSDKHFSPSTELKKGQLPPHPIGDYMRGKKPWNYKGFTYNDQGYKLIFCPDHKFADKDGYVREHRIVVEKIIGRTLHSFEVVHHINEIRDDNRAENLMLFKNNGSHLKYHRGCAISDDDILFRGGELFATTK